MNNKITGRRGFIKTCLTTASALTVLPSRLARSSGTYTTYNRVRLLDSEGEPLTSSSIEVEKGYVINYPYVTTPCFLINLSRSVPASQSPDTNGYRWPGGVGANRSVVAFSAICSHKLSYPTRTSSFINFRPGPLSYLNSDQQRSEGNNLIYCCSERSVYDPARGARVIGGPAPAPLTKIILEHEPDSDQYYAIGTSGVEQYEIFFSKFEFRLALDFKLNDVRQWAEGSVQAQPAELYSQNQVLC